MKTGLTEAGIVIALYGAFEIAQSFLTENTVIPEPWGGVIVLVLGTGVAGLRIYAKAKAINLEEPKA